MSDLDLTRISETFPELLEPQIPHDSFVSLLRDMFTPSQKHVVVRGARGAGKTTLLAHFAMSQRSRCFTFFAGTDYTASDPRYFLLDMCEQMGLVLQDPTPDLHRYDTERLRQLFGDRMHGLARKARSAEMPFYFVIDGLEWIADSGQEQTILKIIPQNPRPNIYILMSCEPGRALPFTYQPWNIPLFEERDTERFLAGLGLSDEDIRRIHAECGGLPGYLAAIRRLMSVGVRFEDIARRLPREFEGLIQMEWERVKDGGDQLMRALAVFAYAKTPLSVAELAQITGISASDIEHQLDSVSFLSHKAQDKIGFLADIHKEFVSAQLEDRKALAEASLIEFYQSRPNERESFIFLPEFISESGDYVKLKALVTTGYLIRGLKTLKDNSTLRRTLRLCVDAGKRTEDWQGVVRFTLFSAVLHTIEASPAGLSEVEALLEMGDFQKAEDLASRALLPEDRLQLLALVYSRKRRSGQPIASGLLVALQEMATDIDLSSVEERTIEIAAALFDVLPHAAIDLVEKADTGGPRRSVDAARAALIWRLESESDREDIALIRTRIVDQSLRDFARAQSPRAAQLTAAQAIIEADDIGKTGGKILLLRTWCNENRTDPDAVLVVARALEIIIGDPEYGTSVRLLRQLAEPLKATTNAALIPVLERLRLLKKTALAEPAEESFRLDLLLIILEGRANRDHATEQLYETYYDLDGSALDRDIRVYCFAHLLCSLSEIDPGDSLVLVDEVESQMTKEFGQLLTDSADHWLISRRLIRIVTGYRPTLAVEFAGRLNTSDRRVRALQAVLWTYISRCGGTAELSIVDDILHRMASEDALRCEYAIVEMIKRGACVGLFAHTPDAMRFIDAISTMQIPDNQCYAYAFAIEAIATTGDSERLRRCADGLLMALQKVEKRWSRVEIGFSVASIVAEKAPTIARTLYASAKEAKETTPLAQEYFADLYMHCIELALRGFSGLLARNIDCSAERQQLLSLIQYLPSFGQQCRFVADLALRHYLVDRTEVFRQLVVEHIIPLLEKCSDAASMAEALVDSAPCLFQYEPSFAFNHLSKISPPYRDAALRAIIVYLLTKTTPVDPVDLDVSQAKADLQSAWAACDAIKRMSNDDSLTSAIELMVEHLVERTYDASGRRREECVKYVERNALEIAKTLEEIAAAKLPDDKNIRHQGYLLIARAHIARLRMAASRRAKEPPPWHPLVAEARSLPNMADKVFVFTNLATAMYWSDSSQAQILVNEAAGLVPLIPNMQDRLERWWVVAKAWKDIDNSSAARVVIEDIIRLVNVARRDGHSDKVMGRALELAHAIDPDFAATLTPLVDNPLEQHKARMDLITENLRQNPQGMTIKTELNLREHYRVLGESAWHILAALNSRAATTQHEREIGRWVGEMAQAGFDDTYRVASWFVQNTVLQSKQVPKIAEIYQTCVEVLQFSMSVGQVVAGLQTELVPLAVFSHVPEELKRFPSGTHEAAISFVETWLSDNADAYVKIYDPYFTIVDLPILRSIERAHRTFIVTSWKPQSGIKPGDKRGIEARYRDCWSGISSEPAPWTQVVVLGTIPEAGLSKSPLHARYVVTKGHALVLDTSIDGLGKTDSVVRCIRGDEVQTIETSYIDVYLNPALRLYNGQELQEHIFIL